jgi:hypothetical protein
MKVIPINGLHFTSLWRICSGLLSGYCTTLSRRSAFDLAGSYFTPKFCPPTRPKKMSEIFKNMFNFFTQRFVRKREYQVIESTNECNENICLEFPMDDKIVRNQQLDVLYKKCKRLISFLSISGRDRRILDELVVLTDEVRTSMYRDYDTKFLFDNFRLIQSKAKLSSTSTFNLSQLNNI